MATLNSVQHFPCPPLPQSPRPAQKSNHPFLFIANVHKRLKLGNSWADASQFSPNAIGINLVLLGYSLLLCNPLQSFCDQWHESSVWVRLRDPTFTYLYNINVEQTTRCHVTLAGTIMAEARKVFASSFVLFILKLSCSNANSSMSGTVYYNEG